MKKSLKTRGRVILICDWCGKKFDRIVSKARTKHHFCSRKCFTEWLTKKYYK